MSGQMSEYVALKKYVTIHLVKYYRPGLGRDKWLTGKIKADGNLSVKFL